MKITAREKAEMGLLVVYSCSGGPASLCFLGSYLGAENVRSEVADVTGIVKYIGKTVFRHQNWGGGYGPLFPPTPPPMY